MDRRFAIALSLCVTLAVAVLYMGFRMTNQKQEPITITVNVISVKMDLNHSGERLNYESI
jgi:hypothetical protein